MSNGSEHTPERNYEKLIEEAREYGREFRLGSSPGSEAMGDLFDGLAEAIEYLWGRVRELRHEWLDAGTEREELRAERDRLRQQLDAIREALTKERVILVERHRGYTVENYSNPLVPVKAIEAVLSGGDKTDD